MTLMRYLEIFCKFTTQQFTGDPKIVEELTEVQKHIISEAQKHQRQPFDLKHPELIEQLEVELALIGITTTCINGFYKFKQDTEDLGYLAILPHSLTLIWSHNNIRSNPLYSITEVVTLLRKQLFKIEVKQ